MVAQRCSAVPGACPNHGGADQRPGPIAPGADRPEPNADREVPQPVRRPGPTSRNDDRVPQEEPLPVTHRSGDHDLTGRGDVHAGAVHDAPWVLAVGQHVERAEVLVVEVVVEVFARLAKVPENHSTRVLREWRVVVLVGKP